MLIIGVALIVAASLALAALIPVFNAPQPPRWTRSRSLGELVTLGIVSTFAIGIATSVAGAWHAWEVGPTLLELAAVVILLGGGVVLWRRLSQGAPATAAPTLAARRPTPHEPQPPQPAKPTARRAA
jgi:hypothetical protein